MQTIINQLILIAGSWNHSGQQDKFLEHQFEIALFNLQLETNTDHEGAMNILLTALN